jgi:hypothetical protein
MVEHAWTIVCRGSAIDIESRMVSLHEIWDEVHVPRDKLADGVSLGHFDIVTLWTKRDDNGKSNATVQVTIQAPDSTEIASTEYKVDLSTYKRLRHRLHVLGLSVHEAGTYQFLVAMLADDGKEWLPVAQLDLDVVADDSDLSQDGSAVGAEQEQLI